MGKEKKRPKAERVYQWWLTHPHWSYAAIGRMFGCSRENVRATIARRAIKPKQAEKGS